MPQGTQNRPFLKHTDIDQLLAAFARQRILVVGDIMLDRYIWGRAERISPEAPVQVVRVDTETDALGGAGNVANNLRALKAGVRIAGVIGDDAPGERIAGFLREKGVDTEGLVRDDTRMSTQKTRVCASSQQVVRIDREHTGPLRTETEQKLCSYIETVIHETDGVLISDYAKGTLTPTVLQRLISLARENRKAVIVDPKGNDYGRYRNATFITPNVKEASAASRVPIADRDDLIRAVDALREQIGDAQVLVTQGKAGMTLFMPGHAPYEIPARAREVFDVSGAGDTVLSVLGLSILSGLDSEQAAWMANIAAGVVVGKVGTSPITVGELKEALWNEISPGLKKFRDRENLVDVVSDLRERGKKIVFTNGCFDLLHTGHIKLFEESKSYGDVLIVALDDDRSVSRIKGADRPILREEERVKIISALDSVDFVTVFPSPELPSLLEKLRPHVLTKGSNYSHEEVTGREVVERYGGQVRLIEIDDRRSVTGLIQRIVERKESGPGA